MRELSGKVAIVTGAAGGMGGGITRRFAEENMTVACLDIADPGPRLRELEGLGSGQVWGSQVDVRDLDALGRAVEEVVDRFGRVDVMVNNAGIEQPLQRVIDTTEDVYREVLDTNLWGVIAGCRAVGHLMAAQEYGSIINTASQLGKVAFETWGIYAASKAGVISVTQAAARELAPKGVRVNAICPGTFDTPLAMRAFEAYGKVEGVTGEEIKESYPREAIGLGRLGDPSDMGALCAFLAGPDASFITGSAINLTGGEQYFF